MNQNKAAVVLRLEDAWAWCMWCHAKFTFHQFTVVGVSCLTVEKASLTSMPTIIPSPCSNILRNFIGKSLDKVRKVILVQHPSMQTPWQLDVLDCAETLQLSKMQLRLM